MKKNAAIWVICVLIAVLCCVPLLSAPEKAAAPDIFAVPPQAMAVYAREQQISGTPWVLLAAADHAQSAAPDAQRVHEIAQKIAPLSGTFGDPIEQGLDALSRYDGSRHFLKMAGRQLLTLEPLYRMLAAGKDIAPGGQAQHDLQENGQSGCTLTGCDQIMAAYNGRVIQAQESTVQIEYENGWCMTFSGLIGVAAQQGGSIVAGEPIGTGETVYVQMRVQGQAIDPYPYILLWKYPEKAKKPVAKSGGFLYDR